MALWKESTPSPTPAPAAATAVNTQRDLSSAETVRLNPTSAPTEMLKRPAATASAPTAERRTEQKESVIASDLSIEGKIEGTGHVLSLIHI